MAFSSANLKSTTDSFASNDSDTETNVTFELEGMGSPSDGLALKSETTDGSPCDFSKLESTFSDACSHRRVPWSFNDRVADVHLIGGYRSQMKPKFWARELQFEMDAQMKDYLLEGICDGFHIVDVDADVPGYHRANYRSVLCGEACACINGVMFQEIIEDKLVLSSHEPLCIHALGAVPKRDGGYRPIVDCKRPLFRSINNYMCTTFRNFKYKSTDDVCDLMQQGAYMASVDVASAYRSISVHPSDWDFQGLRWIIDQEPCFLRDTRLCFGLRCAPYIFTCISDFIVRAMRRRGYAVVNYLDDFWLQGATFETCQVAQLELISLLGNLGFFVSWKKCSSPATKVRYLGMLFDSDNMTISLPQDKLGMLHSELAFFRGKTRATKHQIRRLCGVVAHCAKVVRGGRTFSRRMIDLLKGMPDGVKRIYLNKEFHTDLRWWLDFAVHFNGTSVVIRRNDGTGPSFYTDASLSGYGLVHNADWVAGYFNTSLVPVDYSLLTRHLHWLNVDVSEPANINVLELVPVLVAAYRYCSVWSGQHVVCYSDNSQVVGAVNKGTSINKTSMCILRELFWLSASYNFHLTARHVPGCTNIVPDLLSRISCTNVCSHIADYSLCCSDSVGGLGQGDFRRGGGGVVGEYQIDA